MLLPKNTNLTMIIEHFCSSSNKSTITNIILAHPRANINHVYKNTASKDHDGLRIIRFCENFFHFSSLDQSYESKKIQSFQKNLSVLLTLQKYNLFPRCMKPKFKRTENNGNDCQIYINHKTGFIDHSEFTKCGSAICPICSKSNNFKKKTPLEKVLKQYQHKDKKSVLFLTLDFPHYKNMDLNVLLDILQESTSAVFKDVKFKYTQKKLVSKRARNNQSISDTLKLSGIHQKTELTYSIEHGFHPHNHFIFLCDRSFNQIEKDGIKSRILDLFQKHFATIMKRSYPEQTRAYTDHFKKYSVNLQNVSTSNDGISAYLNKDNTQDISKELTNSQIKNTRVNESYSINNLYQMLENNDSSVFNSKYELIRLISTIVNGLKGKHLNQWRLTNDFINKILETSKSELEANNKEYKNNLSNNSSIGKNRLASLSKPLKKHLLQFWLASMGKRDILLNQSKANSITKINNFNKISFTYSLSKINSTSNEKNISNTNNLLLLDYARFFYHKNIYFCDIVLSLKPFILNKNIRFDLINVPIRDTS